MYSQICRLNTPCGLAKLQMLGFLATIFVALCLSGCSESTQEAPEVVRPVKTRVIGALDPVTQRNYPGTIRAFQHADMAFEVPGRIIEFLAQEGEEIKQGQLLAKLDPRDYEADLEASRANIRKAEADLNRSLSIQQEDPGAISTETIDTHKRALDVARANLQIAEKAVEDTELRAPFDGLLARKLVEDYQNVQAKEPVLVLQNISILEIQIDVPERDIVNANLTLSREELTKRINPKVIVSALPNREFPARLKEFATRADPVTRTFPLKLNFDDPGDVNILPGMTARVRLTVDPERAWSVPVSAAQADEQGTPYVWRIDPDSQIVNRVSVELGDMLADRVQVEAGVNEGDVIAISGVTQLREGMKVRILE